MIIYSVFWCALLIVSNQQISDERCPFADHFPMYGPIPQFHRLFRAFILDFPKIGGSFYKIPKQSPEKGQSNGLITQPNFQIHNMSSFKLIHLSFLGVANSIIQLVCLQYLPLSFFQIMQATAIIFIPILARLFLNKTLYRYIDNPKTYLFRDGPEFIGHRECGHCLICAW